MTQPVIQEKYHTGNPVVRRLLERFFAGVAQAVDGIGAKRILDAGCGEGELVRRGILPAKAEVFSLDIRHEALLEFKRHTPRQLVVHGSVLELPFPSKSVDLAVSLEVLEHLAEPLLALRELKRVSRAGVVVSVPHEPWFRIGNLARGKYVEHLGNHPEHIQAWNGATLERFLRQEFADVRVTGAFPWLIGICRHG